MQRSNPQVDLAPPTDFAALASSFRILLLGLWPLFHRLSQSERREVAARAVHREFAASEQIFQASRPALFLYALGTGRVKLCRPSEGKRDTLLRVLGPRDLCGLSATINDNPYSASATAIEPVNALAWTQKDIKELTCRIPTLSQNAALILARRLQDAQARVLDLSSAPVPQRLAHQLLRLYQPSGRRFQDNCCTEIPLTHAELADMTGASVFTVSRLLNAWQSQGIVSLRRRSVLLSNAHALREIAASDRGADPPDSTTLAKAAAAS